MCTPQSKPIFLPERRRLNGYFIAAFLMIGVKISLGWVKSAQASPSFALRGIMKTHSPKVDFAASLGFVQM